MIPRRSFLKSGTLAGLGTATLTGNSLAAVDNMTASAAEQGSYSVRQFGARGDGRTDDTAAIQRTIDAACAKGGSVLFPHGRYLVTAPLKVRSRAPVSLLGEMCGAFYDAGIGPAILVGAPMSSLIEYSAPDSAHRGASGAGSIKFLAFVDPSTPDNLAPGTRQLGSALHLKDFALGLVQGCSFHWLNGAAITTEMAVMATVSGCRIRYCGNPRRLTPGLIQLGHAGTAFTTQSFLLEDIRIEACYGDPYVRVAEACQDVTIRDCRFEAATVEAPRTSGTFIDCQAERYLIDGCGFNRTNAVAVRMGGRGKLANCHFANAIGEQTTLLIEGSRCIISNSIFEDNRTGLSIECKGYQNILFGNMFYFSGGIRLAGRGNSFKNNQICRPRMKGPGWWLHLSGRSIAESNHFDGDVSDPEVGGIVSTDGDRVTNNSFDRWLGVTCIRRESAQSFIFANTFVDIDRPYDESTPDATRVEEKAAGRLAENDAPRRAFDYARDRVNAGMRFVERRIK